MALKYKAGDRVRIKDIDWYNENINNKGVIVCGSESFTHLMSHFCDKVVTIVTIQDDCYRILEDDGDWYWTDEMIECKVEEAKPEPKFNVGDKVIAYAEGCIAKFSIKGVRWNSELNKFEYKICSSWYDSSVIMQLYKSDKIEAVDENGFPFNERLFYKGAFYIPEGYIFKDENGNVINATKIVLEKKKKEYPKTLGECRAILGIMSEYGAFHYKTELITTFMSLLICRDAYWKIAGDEMGLGKPWEPNYETEDNNRIYVLTTDSNVVVKSSCYHCNYILAFPTEEMRDAFYENFKELIEICKELL